MNSHQAIYEFAFYVLLSIPFIWLGNAFFKDNKGKVFTYSTLYLISYLILYTYGDSAHPHLYSIIFLTICSVIIYGIINKNEPANPFSSDNDGNFKLVKKVNTSKILSYPRLSIRDEDEKDYIFDASDIKEINKEFPDETILCHFKVGGPMYYRNKQYVIQEIKIDILKEFIDYYHGTTKNFTGEEIPYNIQIFIKVIKSVD